ncbi:unnamed protein product [Caenorhabditis sp. 36 PRJEB53466]|nr:unnamed protein product [Caenorhabditis sp. 36 PRJEB53466]
MTINGIWEWANQMAQRVPPEVLRGKTLSIDGHIWLYESVKGSEAHHSTCAHPYLVTFFNRIQHLKELKIVPIVVFDNVYKHHEVFTDQSSFRGRKRRSGRDRWGETVDWIEQWVNNTRQLLYSLGVTSFCGCGDGEAQCARLEELGLTAGCITTDFDYFLYGGKNLYRFDFGANSIRAHDVTHLSMGRMVIDRKVSRCHLIVAAILLGCDYYESGVRGVGIATVFEILHEFAAEDGAEFHPHVVLDRFASYVRGEIPARSSDGERKLSFRRKNYRLDSSFPNGHNIGTAIQMYQQPPVFDAIPSRAIPKSSAIDMRKVEEMFMRMCKWTPERMQKELRTSQRRAKVHANLVSQTRIPEFFAASRKRPIVEPCDTLDDYISANNSWIEKKRKSSERLIKIESPPRKRSRRIELFVATTHPSDIIELGDSE